ncbi:hypothetical protein [Novipirellula artificiosorum]|nr:hypothetical protein [Novipirellula artificiosorum]
MRLPEVNTGRLLAADRGPPEAKGKPKWGSSLAFYAAMADLMPIESTWEIAYVSDMPAWEEKKVLAHQISELQRLVPWRHSGAFVGDTQMSPFP